MVTNNYEYGSRRVGCRKSLHKINDLHLTQHNTENLIRRLVKLYINSKKVRIN